ncbi:hypothetical protein EDC18_101529 [Natranaerovirga pectinivora]|uniref:Uncharacterized protein n=1 Tax=Natranaerovirga pectinivora TaxID=682400 RepID=A0A4R3MPR7_9FIRM|nr:hypothetical protein EDC18_101529 [Natranaerovirga pectinivora]
MACGTSMGKEEMKKKLGLRIQDLYQKKEIRLIDDNGEEINYDKVIHLLFDKK